ncbi:MAG: radical SAM protein [Acidobacteria bacterium]|nr:radical SAM protein [Acidobacteriota bacterium]
MQLGRSEARNQRPATGDQRLALVEALIQRYPRVPQEAIVKTDMLRAGIAFSQEALRVAAQHKLKAYFIFSFDLVPLAEMENQEHWHAPEEICLEGGPYGFRRTIVSVRLNPASPYHVEVEEDKVVLKLDGTTICNVGFQPVPEYYNRTLSNGKRVIEIAPTIEWGYLVYLTTYRICQYFGKQEECQFCDLNENYRQQIQAGRPYTGVKSIEEILEALEIINETDSEKVSQAYTITGGSITTKLKGLSEADFYAPYAEAIEKKFPRRWISKMVVQALPRDEVKKFKDVGVQIYHPNYEIWDERLFNLICPGKARFVGRNQWIKRVLDAAEIFGPANVIPNFVAGIEMAKPYGFQTVTEAIKSTSEGLDFFMSHRICPRFTVWCPEPLTELGPLNPEGAPLEYHVRLLETWRDTHAKYRLPIPAGYGEPGVGRAVFSVSAFMDVVDVDNLPSSTAS